MRIAVDGPAEIRDHTVVMTAEYVGVCFSLIDIFNLDIIVKNGVRKGFTVVMVREQNWGC